MRNSKRSAIVGGTIAVLMAGGIAFAAWSTDGAGNTTATANTEGAGNLAISQTAAVIGLYPGTSGTQQMTVRVTNDNPYQVSLTNLTPGSIVADSAHATAGCTAATHGVTAVLTGSLPDTIAAGAFADNTFDISMAVTSSDACKGATFTVPFTAAGASN